MAKTSQELYGLHVDNERRISIALRKIPLTIREAISDKDETVISSFLPLYMLLLSAWAECKLRKLLYEPNAFTDGERSEIVQKSVGNGKSKKRTHFEQWQQVIDVAFEKHFSISPLNFSISLPSQDLSRYLDLNDLLRDSLKPLIEIRNKLAHGQWEYPLNSAGNNISSDFKTLIDSENILSLQFKKSLITSLLKIVHDLAVSKPTFDRDYDEHYNHIRQTQNNLNHRSYTKYVDSLINKKARGIEDKKMKEEERQSKSFLI